MSRSTIVAFESSTQKLFNHKHKSTHKSSCYKNKGCDYGTLQKAFSYGLALFSVWHSKLHEIILEFPEFFSDLSKNNMYTICRISTVCTEFYKFYTILKWSICKRNFQKMQCQRTGRRSRFIKFCVGTGMMPSDTRKAMCKSEQMRNCS